MDSVVDAALEEICPLINGLLLRDLWPKLHSSLSSIGLQSSCPNVKKALWNNLLNIPGLQFQCEGVSYEPQDPRIQAWEDSEALNLTIVAADHLRDSFFGIFDIKPTENERRVLERLAITRKNGIAQNELAKEFGMKSKNIFHVIKNLELRGLIVRQSTVIKKNEARNVGDPKCVQIITTSMLYLQRHAKNLGCEQKLEFTKNYKTVVDDETADSGNDLPDKGTTVGVQIKDNLADMQAICDKLEKADGKFLAVSDIKKDLGYKGSHGHKSWRSICCKMKSAHLVEEFRATVNKKEVNCLRLLKKFSPKIFEPKPSGDGYEYLDAEQPVKLGKRGQVTDQLVELPIDHQFYNMIDSQGSKGLTFTEVCKRLGISRRTDNYLRHMVRRFGLHVQEGMENGIRSFRVWTRGNFNPQVSYIPHRKLEDALDKGGLRRPCVGQGSAPMTRRVSNCTSKTDAGDSKKIANVAVKSGLSNHSPTIKCNIKKAGSSIPGAVPKKSMAVSSQSDKKYLCINLDAVRAQREQRILQMLQEEKFLIKAVLQRQLTSLEKEKQTVMDRKTLDRSLSKLQQEGLCKCIHISAPSVTNCGSRRTTAVLLHPSVFNVTPQLLTKIYERLRSFEGEVRKKSESFSTLNGTEGSHRTVKLDAQSERSEFASAKMVRLKLLHIYLWDYFSCLPDWDDAFSDDKKGYDQKNPHSMCTLFDLDAAIKAMPLHLFLHVVGSPKHVEDTIEKDRLGLCLSDIPMKEYKCLMDTQANIRLSNLIDKLRRLKLIKLVSDEVLDGPELYAMLRFSLELKPYIEEPVQKVLASPGFGSPDIRPCIRHNFVLSSRKNVEEYWNKSEHCRASFDSKAAFPGSTSQERASNANVEKLHQQKCQKIFLSLKRKRCSEGRPSNDISDPAEANIEQEASNEDGGEDHSFIEDCALEKLKPLRQRRFSWTENADRQLVIEYVRHRVALGGNFHRTNWASLPNLPSSMHTCRRRMALLNSNKHFRKAVMKFCNMLSERYIKHVEAKSNSSDHADELDFEEKWDDFENQNVKLALDEVLQYKQTAKLEAAQGGGAVFESSTSSKMDGDRHVEYDCRYGKYIKLMEGGKVAKRRAYESLSVCNAAELFNVVFLSTSVAPKLMNWSVQTLKCYSDQDLFAAFNYLKERKIMVRGSGDRSFQLSQQFLQNLYSSPFPINTGQRAAKMASLLNERENELLEEGIDLSADLQCGEVFHLCALLSSGEFSLSPCLPDQGVGEAEETKSLKRKSSDSEFCEDNKAKKLKNIFSGDITHRRDKGFPGIKLSLRRCTVSNDGDDHVGLLPSSGADRVKNSTESNLAEISSPSDNLKKTVLWKSFITKTVAPTESPWDAMACYAGHLVSQSCVQEHGSYFCPDIFRNIHSAIDKAGDQGLSMLDISQIMSLQGDRQQEGPELIVEVLEVFGLANMVNAYDSVRVVDSSYRSKYFLTSKAGTRREIEEGIVKDSRNSEPENQEISMKANEKHTVPFLNHSPGRDNGDEAKLESGDSSICKPILPWMNADGTMNQIVYKGLVRNILGIVMQNPGILQENVISRMRVLNPQICKKLLEMMILEKHIVVRKMYQTTYNGPPSILGVFFKNKLKETKPIYQQHLFANPISTNFL